MAVERGFAGELCIGDATTSGNMRTMDVIDESMSATYTWVDGNGIKGTRARSKECTAVAEIPCGGGLTINPKAGDLTYLLPKITGDTSPSSGLHKLQETLPDFFLVKRPSNLATSRVSAFTGCMVSRAEFAAARSQPLRLSMEMLAKSVGESSTYPTSPAAIEVADPFFMFHGLTVALAGTTYEVFDWRMTIDHVLAPRAVNSRFFTQLYPTDRIVTVQVNIPYGDVSLTLASGLLSAPFGDSTFSHTATFASGSDSILFECDALRTTHVTPRMQRGEVVYQITAQAFKTGTSSLTDQEVDITLTDG